MPRTVLKGRVRRQLVGKPRWRGGRLQRYRRVGMYNPMPTFTETADFGTFGIAPAGVSVGQLQATLSSIPQINQYAALYNCARILKIKFMIVPQFTQYAPDPSVAATAQSVAVPRFVYSIQDTSSVPPPTNELDVLTDNGCKIRLLNRPFNITCRPAPQLGEAISTGGFAPVTKKKTWLTMNASGLAVPHIGVNYAAVCDSLNTGNPQVLYNVYAKITFQLRDPK